MTEKLLEIKNMKVSLMTGKESIRIIRDFSMQINEGEIVGILGESGSGKTVSSSMIARIYDDSEGSLDSGHILFKGRDIAKMGDKQLNKIRGKQISYIFQNPSQALNPYKKVGKQLEDLMKTHNLDFTEELIQEIMIEVGLDNVETVYNMFPVQLSGGQNQRIVICQSILCRPDLLIADEPTSSIDAMLRKKILNLLLNLNKKYGMAIIFITHDFDVAKYLCDRLVIMYGGLVVEEGEINAILEKPLHPYTDELIKCSSSLDSQDQMLYSLDGNPPVPAEFNDECPFLSRCRHSRDICSLGIPKMSVIGDREVRCFLHHKKGIENV